MRKNLIVVCLSIFIAFVAEARPQSQSQSINFDDLKHPGGSGEKSWTLDGVTTEAQDYFRQYGSTDDVRTEQRRSSRSTASNYTPPSSSGSSGKQYKCEYSCYSSGNIAYTGGSTKALTTIVSAASKSSAERIIEKSLWDNNTCKGMKSSGGLSLLPKAVCRE